MTIEEERARRVMASVLPSDTETRRTILKGGNGGAISIQQAIAAMLAFAAEQAPATQGVREGFVMVPRVPTEAMMAAAHDGPLMASDYPMDGKQVAFLRDIWSAMISAALARPQGVEG